MAGSWLDLLSTTTIISTILQFLTGTLVCLKYIRNKSTGESSALPFVSGFLSCALWLNYGLLTDEYSVIVVNITGTTLFLGYVITFFFFTVNKKLLLKQVGFCLLVIVLVVAFCKTNPDKDHVIQVMGLLCCTVTVLFFAAPLSNISHVIRVKNSESLPFPMILPTFFVCLQWVIYGLAIDDLFIQVPNVLGCLLASAQLSLFYFYPSRSVSGPAYKVLNQNV